MAPKGGISGFLWIEFVVRWSIICPLGSVFGAFFSRESQKNADLFYHKPSVRLNCFFFFFFFLLVGFVLIFHETILKKVDPNFADRFDQSGRPTPKAHAGTGNGNGVTVLQQDISH